MKTLDIRNTAEQINRIVFGDGIYRGFGVAYALDVSSDHSEGLIYIDEADGGGRDGDTVRIAINDIPNLILALQKAQELAQVA